MLDQAHHVVAQIAEQAGGDGRQVGRHVDAAFGDQRAQRIQRRGLAGHEGGVVPARRAVDARGAVAAFPYQIGLHPDHGIAAANLAPGHRFKEEGMTPPMRKLQHQRHRRVQIGGEPGPDKLVAARLEPLTERRQIGVKRHLSAAAR